MLFARLRCSIALYTPRPARRYSLLRPPRGRAPGRDLSPSNPTGTLLEQSPPSVLPRPQDLLRSCNQRAYVRS